MWDRRRAIESLGYAVVLLGLAFLVTAATDEGGLAWTERVARVVPLAPLGVAVAVALTLAGPRRRVETRALEALGRSPFVNSAGAASGAALVGVVVALLVLVDGRVPVRGFFPSLRAASVYAFDEGGFTSLATGIHVALDGSLMLPPAPTAAVDTTSGLPPHARLAACLVTGMASLAFALLIARLPRQGRTSSLLVLVATGALTTFAFQAAAAGRLPALATPVPATVLLLGAAWAIVRAEWEPTIG